MTMNGELFAANFNTLHIQGVDIFDSGSSQRNIIW